MLNMFCITNWVLGTWLLINLAFLAVSALPATTSAPTTHIVSYVQQRRAKAKSDELREFDFEHIKSSNGSDKLERLQQQQNRTPIQQLYGRLVQQLDMNLDNSNALSAQSTNKAHNKTDDLFSQQANTLANADDIFGNNTHHESAVTLTKHGNAIDLDAGAWNRMKQSIPVLEPVKHLINTVREGAFNMTTHVARQHHQLVNAAMGGSGGMAHQNESNAIETEQEREMANESSEFKLLDFLGSILGMIWSFIGNIQKAFFASSGNASAASSASSSK